MAGQEFSFPANPEDGYVESSIYIWSVHNPVDVLRIKFDELKDGGIEATLDLRFGFEYEGCCSDLDKTFSLLLRTK